MLKKKKFLIYVLFVLGFSFLSEAQSLKHILEVKSSKLIGSALKVKVPDNKSSIGYIVSLTKQGEGIKFSNLPVSDQIAIHYASVSVGTISIAVDNQPIRKINIHSSGSLTESFLYSIIAIPNRGSVTIKLDDNDIAVNIDKIIVGKNDLGLPPDIWNLPALPVAAGSYPADWEGLSRIYSVPDWWREAKFGAWSHWDPQSMPEQGDWYARGMYMQGDKQYEYNLKNFGHTSEYGYKDICHNWLIDKWNPEELMNLYVEMGAKYFMAMGVHHDNFDCWDSKYQPWNSVNVGPKQDIVGT